MLWCVVNGKKARAAAPTGIAASNIEIEGTSVSATTLHAMFDLDTDFVTKLDFAKIDNKKVKALMDLFVYVLKREVNKLDDNNIRLRIIGHTAGLSAELQRLIVAAEEKTSSNTGLQLSIAANYGGRWDILEAAKKMAADVKENGTEAESITEDVFGQYLSLGDLPAVDLCIRTSGEQRISNFLLWQLAYAELVFVDTLWPEFKHQKMVDTLVQFGQRQRRFGQTGTQLIEQESNA
jgi:undecaprenyl diphosphate synthase